MKPKLFERRNHNNYTEIETQRGTGVGIDPFTRAVTVFRSSGH